MLFFINYREFFYIDNKWVDWDNILGDNIWNKLDDDNNYNWIRYNNYSYV